MNNKRELYQEVIIDHGRHPRNTGVLDNATHEKEGFNPLCGDKVTVYCHLKGNTLETMRFVGCGCAISMASASLMSQIIQGKTIEEIRHIFDLFHDMMTGSGKVDENSLGKLSVLAGVGDYPARVKCAMLVWYTLLAALNKTTEEVTTE